MEDNKMLIGWIKEPNRYRLVPDKEYEIKYDERGFFYLEKKKKEYPKTYKECCKVMNYCCNPVSTKTTHKEGLIRKFQFLLMYRDTYWKIAGEEMGLGKPWEPDLLDDNQPKFALANWDSRIENRDYSTNRNYVLTFPTKEMRDAFKENFDKDLETCKELL